ncbi:polymerase, partial [Globisporangium splendens]
MSNEDVAIAATRTDAASRSLSTLSLIDFAGAVKKEPPLQADFAGAVKKEPPVQVDFASAVKKEPVPQAASAKQPVKKTAAAKKQQRKATGNGADTSDNGSNSNSNAGNQSSGAKRKTVSNPPVKHKKTDSSNNNNGSSNSKAKTPPKSAKQSVVTAAPESTTFVPLHMPAWKPDIAFVNGTTIPIASRLGQEMTNYCTYTREIVENLQRSIDDAIAHISTCVQTIWPEATVACFGSFASGLWLPSSDVDVVVMGISNDKDPDVKTRFVLGVKELQQIASRLRKQKWVQRIEVVGSAKVPVAKLVLAENDLRVDISIENLHTQLGIEASDLVREYITAMPVLHSLIVVLKQLLREKGLNNAFTGGLSSYAVALMAFYLIERQGMTDASSPEALGQLLLDFLEFYGMTFSYATTGLSLKPEAFGEYFLAHHITMSSGMALMPQLVIDDPVYHDGQHNAAAGAFAIARVIAAFENAFYAISFHRPSKFTPTPLCQILHWSGHSSPPTAG